MTTQPHPAHFDTKYTAQHLQSPLLRPNVREHFWGYEVRPNEHVIGVAALLRGLCGFLTVTSLAAAFGVWLVPAVAFTGEAVIVKAIATVVLVGIAIVAGQIAARGAQVRVQIDTATGEFREVVDGAMGNNVVLARYGFDTLEKIEVVAARANGTFGQLQVTFRGADKIACSIPVGDGGVLLLGPLRSRLARDCGLDLAGSTRKVNWPEPLAA